MKTFLLALLAFLLPFLPSPSPSVDLPEPTAAVPAIASEERSALARAEAFLREERAEAFDASGAGAEGEGSAAAGTLNGRGGGKFAPCTADERKETLLQESWGQVIEPGTCAAVRLFGRTGEGPYVTDVRIEVRADGRIFVLSPPVNDGYDPRIMLGPFTEAGTDQIFLGMTSGGSGGFGFFYLFDLTGGKPVTLFDFQDWPFRDSACYEDGFKVRVDTEETSFLIDLSDRPREQLAPIYQPDGTLIAPKKADVSALNYVFPSFNATTGRFELTAFQRITGLYSADLLGYLIRQMVFREGSFSPSWTLVGVTGV